MTAPVAPVVPRPETRELAVPLAVPIVDPKEERLARIHEAFRVLAGAGDELGVANFLKELGIRGSVAISDLCPVALYIFATTGVRVLVGQSRWWTLDPLTPGSATPGRIPDCVRGFIYNFDQGAFPELQSSRGRWQPLPSRATSSNT